MSGSPGSRATRSDSVFSPTRVSLLAALRDGDSKVQQQALGSLCEIYWYPLYCYARRYGLSSEDAQDVVQDFLSHAVERKVFERADPGRGRLRAFLLGGLKHQISEWRREQRAEKRGGGVTLLSLSAAQSEERYSSEPVDPCTPEQIFARHWAQTIFDQVRAELAGSWQAKDKSEQFKAFAPYLLSEMSQEASASLAVELKLTQANVKVTVHRLRQEFSERLRVWVAQTVSSPKEIPYEMAELAALFRYL
jgi:RNA polymerase sigma factor (sigma-70 family)